MFLIFSSLDSFLSLETVFFVDLDFRLLVCDFFVIYLWCETLDVIRSKRVCCCYLFVTLSRYIFSVYLFFTVNFFIWSFFRVWVIKYKAKFLYFPFYIREKIKNDSTHFTVSFILSLHIYFKYRFYSLSW